jgi:hypothetical protein
MQDLLTKNTYDNLAQQAKVQVWASLLTFISMVTTLVATRGFLSGYMGTAIVFTVITIVLMGVNVYNANCLIKGNCNKWGWVVVGSSFFFAILEFALLMYSIMSGKKLTPQSSSRASDLQKMISQNAKGGSSRVQNILNNHM